MLRFLNLCLVLILLAASQSPAAVVLTSSSYSLSASVSGFPSDTASDSGFTGVFVDDATAGDSIDQALASIAGVITTPGGDLLAVSADGSATATSVDASSFSRFLAVFEVTGGQAFYTLLTDASSTGSASASAKFFSGVSPFATEITDPAGLIDPGIYSLQFDFTTTGIGDARGFLSFTITQDPVVPIPLPAAAWSGLTLLAPFFLRRVRFGA